MTLFIETANHIVRESLHDLEKGNYLSSWSRTIPARLAYLADAITETVTLPFACLGTFFVLSKRSLRGANPSIIFGAASISSIRPSTAFFFGSGLSDFNFLGI